MKIKFEAAITRAEWKLVQSHMAEVMEKVHTHFPTLPREEKTKLKSRMIRDLNRVPGLSVKSKNRFGGYMFFAGLKDDIVLELEIDSNADAVAAMFDIAGVMADIAGPFLNAFMVVSQGTALKELKVVYDMYTRKSKPTEFTVVRTTENFEEK